MLRKLLLMSLSFQSRSRASVTSMEVRSVVKLTRLVTSQVKANKYAENGTNQLHVK